MRALTRLWWSLSDQPGGNLVDGANWLAAQLRHGANEARQALANAPSRLTRSPDVVGMPLAAAQERLAAAGFRSEVVEADAATATDHTVHRQEPPGNSPLSAERVVIRLHVES